MDDIHCNPKAAWEKPGSPDTLTREEVTAIKDSTRLAEENLDFTTDEGMTNVPLSFDQRCCAIADRKCGSLRIRVKTAVSAGSWSTEDVPRDVLLRRGLWLDLRADAHGREVRSRKVPVREKIIEKTAKRWRHTVSTFLLLMSFITVQALPGKQPV